MLCEFQSRVQFNKVKMCLWVDCVKREVYHTLVYNSRIVPQDSFPNYEDVDTPEKADRWMSERIEGVEMTLKMNKK